MSKLQTLLKSFDSAEKKQFRNYVTLCHSADSKTCKLLDWILSPHKKNSLLDLTIEKLYDQSNKEVKLQTFKNAISDLGNIAEEYIGWEAWKSHKELGNTSKLLGFANRGLKENYLKLQKTILEPNDTNTVDIFTEYYKTIALYYDYNFNISESKDIYTELFQNLITTFKTGVAKVSQSLLVEVKNRERLLKNEDWSHEIEFFDLLYEHPSDIKHITNRLIMLNDEQDEDAYQELLDILKDNKNNRLSHFLRHSIVMYCSVYLNGLSKSGNHQKVKELLSLYEYGLENNLIRPTHTMDIMTFINLVAVFSKIGTADQARDIITKYANKVDYPDKKVVTQLATSTVDFTERKFEKVLEEIRSVEPSGFQLKFKFRWLHLKALIEVQNEYPSVILGQISNFRRYINDNKSQINSPTYLGMISTIKILKMIIDKNSKESILHFISECNMVFEKKWILQFLEPIK